MLEQQMIYVTFLIKKWQFFCNLLTYFSYVLSNLAKQVVDSTLKTKNPAMTKQFRRS